MTVALPHSGHRDPGIGAGCVDEGAGACRMPMACSGWPVRIQHAQHRVAVHDQTRQVRHGRGPDLLPLLPVRQSGHDCHEVAQRLGVVQELAQLYADPGRIEHAHVEREDAHEAVQRPRVVA
jgi:hypothetical protein